MNMDQPGRMNPEHNLPEDAGTENAKDKMKHSAETVAGETRDAARTVTQTAKEQAQRVGRTVKDQTAEVGSQARTVLREQAETAKSGLAHTLDEAAVRVREKANDANRNDLGMRLAQPLERSADYLRQTPLENMPQDLSHSIQANPLRAVAIAFGVGMVLGRVFKKR